MSSIVSRRPSSRNHWNDAFWMSIRLGRSRTCFRREKLLRARGAATPLVNYEASLENGSERWRTQARTWTAGTGQLSERGQAYARAKGRPWRSAGSIAEASALAAARRAPRPALVPSLEEVMKRSLLVASAAALSQVAIATRPRRERRGDVTAASAGAGSRVEGSS